MEQRFCRFCEQEHPLTIQYWTRLHYSPRCKKRINETRKVWADNNREYLRQKQRESYQKHREKVIRRNYIYARKRKETDKGYKLSIILRQRLNKALRGNYKVGSAVKDLGCSVEEFRIYLESKFQNGMTWENYGRTGWHIDHIVPLSSFNLENESEFKQATHYTNMQPLWATENIKKGNIHVL